MGMNPEDIDATFIPWPKPSVADVELDGERFLYDTESRRLHRLDRVGSIIWACLDGAATISDLSSDLAEAFGAEIAQVRIDVLALVRHLAAEDLLAVRLGAPEEPKKTDHAVLPVPEDERPGPKFLTDPPGG